MPEHSHSEHEHTPDKKTPGWLRRKLGRHASRERELAATLKALHGQVALARAQRLVRKFS